MSFGDVVGILSRWVHILSVIFLLGGVIWARMVLVPALDSLPGGDRQRLGDRIAANYRSTVITAVVLILASGIYNLLNKANLPSGYHMVFGVKMLLVLHIFAVGILLGKPGVEAEKRKRWMTGIVATGSTVVLLSAILRWLSR